MSRSSGSRGWSTSARERRAGLSDLQNLIRTAEIEAAIAAVVVALSLVRRRQRRARARARLRTAGQTAAAGPPQPGPETAD